MWYEKSSGQKGQSLRRFCERLWSDGIEATLTQMHEEREEEQDEVPMDLWGADRPDCRPGRGCLRELVELFDHDDEQHDFYTERQHLTASVHEQPQRDVGAEVAGGFRSWEGGRDTPRDRQLDAVRGVDQPYIKKALSLAGLPSRTIIVQNALGSDSPS